MEQACDTLCRDMHEKHRKTMKNILWAQQSEFILGLPGSSWILKMNMCHFKTHVTHMPGSSPTGLRLGTPRWRSIAGTFGGIRLACSTGGSWYLWYSIAPRCRSFRCSGGWWWKGSSWSNLSRGSGVVGFVRGKHAKRCSATKRRRRRQMDPIEDPKGSVWSGLNLAILGQCLAKSRTFLRGTRHHQAPYIWLHYFFGSAFGKKTVTDTDWYFPRRCHILQP